MSDKRNVYEKIVDEWKALIEVGAVAEGAHLPSVRAYGVERKVNPNTVAKAYAALEKEGYIRVEPKKGAFVCRRSAVKTQPDDEVTRKIAEWKAAGVPRESVLAIVEEVYDRN